MESGIAPSPTPPATDIGRIRKKRKSGKVPYPATDPRPSRPACQPLHTQHREENTHETLDQHLRSAHDAAHDDATNVEIQNVGAFIELGGGFHHDIRQQAVIDQRGRNERGANRCRAHLADERKTFAEFAAGESKTPAWRP